MTRRWASIDYIKTQDQLDAYVAEHVAAEREACAKVAEKLLEHSNANYATAAELIAAAIRARKDEK